MSQDNKIKISLVIPVKDEEESIPNLFAEIEGVMKKVPYSWECLWIDDGSKDKTASIMESFRAKNSAHEYLKLAGNFGQSAAMMAGFRAARGEYIITLDADGQNDPADIPELIDFCIKQNADMVNGYRLVREDSIVRIISSRVANFLRNVLTKENIRDVGCSMRIFRRECVQDIFLFKGMHRFLPTLVRINGYNSIMEKGVHHRPRNKGLSKYGISNRLWVGIADAMAVRWMMQRKVSPRVAFSSMKD